MKTFKVVQVDVGNLSKEKARELIAETEKKFEGLGVKHFIVSPKRGEVPGEISVEEYPF